MVSATANGGFTDMATGSFFLFFLFSPRYYYAADLKDIHEETRITNSNQCTTQYTHMHAPGVSSRLRGEQKKNQKWENHLQINVQVKRRNCKTSIDI
jgi:hypothetical protein